MELPPGKLLCRGVPDDLRLLPCLSPRRKLVFGKPEFRRFFRKNGQNWLPPASLPYHVSGTGATPPCPRAVAVSVSGGRDSHGSTAFPQVRL